MLRYHSDFGCVKQRKWRVFRGKRTKTEKTNDKARHKAIETLAFCSIDFEGFCANFTTFCKTKKTFLKLFTKSGEMCYNNHKKKPRGNFWIPEVRFLSRTILDERLDAPYVEAFGKKLS